MEYIHRTLRLSNRSNHVKQRSRHNVFRNRFNNGYGLLNGNGSEELFPIEAVVDERTRNGVREYLVKWEGYETDDNTWESEQNLRYGKEKINEFKRRSLFDFNVGNPEISDETDSAQANDMFNVKPQSYNHYSHSSDIPECILGAKKTFDGRIAYLVQWNNYNSFVIDEECKEKFPQLLIKFFEKNLSFVA